MNIESSNTESEKEKALQEMRRLAANSRIAEPVEDWTEKLNARRNSPESVERARREQAASEERSRKGREEHALKIQELQSDPVRLEQEYTKAIGEFIKAELNAGATLQQLDRRHAGNSLANGLEKERLDFVRSAFSSLRGQEEYIRFSEKTFENELTRLREAGGEQLNESIREKVMSKLFSYQDADLPQETKTLNVQLAKESEGGKKYADALIQMTNTYDIEYFEHHAKDMVQKCQATLDKLGIKPTPYTNSVAWGIWDMGKQYHFLLHPEENDPKYRIADPMKDPDKRREIVDRHVGWEAYAAWRYGHKDFINRVPEGIRNRALEYLEREPKQLGTLPSNELAELGSLLRL